MSRNSNAVIPEGQLAFDSGVIVEMLNGTELGSLLTASILVSGRTAYTTSVNLAEAEYILCRKIGQPRARKKVEDLVASGCLYVKEEPRIHSIAAILKCERAISLPDCYTFAVAEMTSSRPVFVFQEKEILMEIERKPFPIAPVFLT